MYEKSYEFSTNCEKMSIFHYCSQIVSREVFFVSEGHLQNLPLAASYGCLATENLRHTSQNSIVTGNLE